MRWPYILLAALVAIVAIAAVGLKVRPRLVPLGVESADRGTVELLPDLPAPVARFAEEVARDGLPRIETLAITGHGEMRRGGVTMPLRWRGVYRPGSEFSRTMEVTWFGMPVLRGLDTWLDGAGRMDIAGQVSTGPEMDQGQNMAAWAEAMFTPTVMVTDPRLTWEPIDDTHARLVIPREDGTDELIYEFDPETGRPLGAESMRFRDGETERLPWITRTLEWGRKGGMLVPTVTDVRWGDMDKPWATLRIDDLAINVPAPEIDESR